MVRYLHHADHNPAKIRKIEKAFAREPDFKNIKRPVKFRGTHKIDKRIISTLVFLVIKTKKHIQFMFQKFLSKDMWICILHGKKEKFLQELVRFL